MRSKRKPREADVCISVTHAFPVKACDFRFRGTKKECDRLVRIINEMAEEAKNSDNNPAPRTRKKVSRPVLKTIKLKTVFRK